MWARHRVVSKGVTHRSDGKRVRHRSVGKGDEARNLGNRVKHRAVLKRGKKSVPKRQSCKKTACSSYVQPWLNAICGWRLVAIGGWWQLVAVGGW